MSRLSHPNCVSVIDFGVDGEPYLVMDFVTGRTLRAALNDGRAASHPPAPSRRPPAAVRGSVTRTRRGSFTAISKPENLILTDEAGLADHLRILDFGLARLRDGPVTTVGMALGTPSYTSPEQGAPTGPPTRAAISIRSGCCCSSARRRANRSSLRDSATLFSCTARRPPPRVGALAAGGRAVHRAEAVVSKAMAKRQGDWFQSAAEFRRALDDTPEGRARRPSAERRPLLRCSCRRPSNPP